MKCSRVVARFLFTSSTAVTHLIYGLITRGVVRPPSLCVGPLLGTCAVCAERSVDFLNSLQAPWRCQGTRGYAGTLVPTEGADTLKRSVVLSRRAVAPPHWVSIGLPEQLGRPNGARRGSTMLVAASLGVSSQPDLHPLHISIFASCSDKRFIR